MTRNTKSDRQRAEELLAVAARRVTRLTTERAVHKKAIGAIDAALVMAKARQDFLKLDPALKGEPPKAVTSVTSISTPDKGQVLMNEASTP